MERVDLSAANGGSPALSSAAPSKRFTEKLAHVGRHVFVAAMTGLRGRDDGGRVELPRGLREAPTGTVAVRLSSSADSPDEVFRDFARVLQGGSVFVIGRQRLYPVRPTAASQEGVHSEARTAAFEDLRCAIQEELIAQGCGLSPAGKRQASLWRRPTLGEMAHTASVAGRAEVDDEVLREIALQVVSHVSVGPGVQVAMSRGLPPTLWQPSFTVCIGAGQVRVLTFAFVGDPVIGDRPDRKRTPFCMRIATEDLVEVAATRVQGNPREVEARVFYVAEPVAERINSTLDYIVAIEDELFQTIEDGGWSTVLRCGAAPIGRSDACDEWSQSLARALAASEDIAVGAETASYSPRRSRPLTSPGEHFGMHTSSCCSPAQAETRAGFGDEGL